MLGAKHVSVPNRMLAALPRNDLNCLLDIGNVHNRIRENAG